MAHDAHALAAAARHRLDEERKSHGLRLLREPRLRLLYPKVARDNRHACDLHQFLRLILHAHHADGSCRRADEDDAGRGAGFCELGALGEKPVARMQRLGGGCLRRLDKGGNIEVACGSVGGADAHGRIGETRMQRVCIGVGVDRDDAHAEPLRRAGDAAGDLAAVGDQ